MDTIRSPSPHHSWRGWSAPRGLVAGLALILWTGAAAPSASRVATSARETTASSVWDAVYSGAQARRGEAWYRQSCAGCHKDDLSGFGTAPPLSGEAFMESWVDRTVGDLFTSIRTTMPQDDPGGLNRQACLDIVAFILQSNKFPAGTEELPDDADVLKAIRILGKHPSEER